MRLTQVFAGIAAAISIGASALAADLTPPVRIAVRVEPGDWGTARTQDIERVLTLVANLLFPHFPQRASDRIVVEYGKQGPRALFEKSTDGAYRVLLNVQHTRWDQFAYQFSHELCHVFTNFEHRDVRGNAAAREHQWFEEALCEAVSLFALNRIASSWERSPPYPGWEHYAPAFREYAERVLNGARARLTASESIARWYDANREELDRNPYRREKNELVATRLLPLLESTPGSLEAIGYLNFEKPPAGKGFRAYLESWYSCCPGAYRAFIGQVIALIDERDGSGKSAMVPTLSN